MTGFFSIQVQFKAGFTVYACFTVFVLVCIDKGLEMDLSPVSRTLPNV